MSGTKYPNINAERVRKGMTFEDVAKRYGVGRKTVYTWLHKGNIPLRVLCDMSDFFGCSIDYLLGRTDT